jgi:transcriptional regulator with GAF, ATPase, and Fis domain
MEYWRGMLASGKSGEIEGRLRRFDAVYRWFYFRATPAFDESGRVVKWYGTNTAIELRKQAEQILAVQNTRLQLLLKLTSQITSNLELREVLRAISASIRELMRCDLVHVSLPDAASGKFRVHALDFPESKGFVKEELLINPVGVAKQALEQLEPAIRSTANREDFPPDYYELLVAEGVKSQCVIPLVN